MTANSLNIDIDEAKRFLKALDPTTEKFTFQTFDDKGNNNALVKVLHGTLDEHAGELRRLNEMGAGVFVTVNETDLKGRKAKNITRVRAVYVDLDGAPLEPVTRHHVQPHIIVESSEGRWHAYWLVNDMPLNDFRGTQELLIKEFGADEAVKDLPRVMRLPGFLHQKKEPRAIRIKTISGEAPYPARIFKPSVQDDGMEEMGSAGDNDERALQILDEQCQSVAEPSPASRTRNNNLNKAAYTVGGLVGSGLLSENTVRDKLLEAADACGLPRNEAKSTITSGLSAGMKCPWSPGMLLDPQDPMRSAIKFLDLKYSSEEGVRTLHRHRETFWAWNGACFEIKEKETMEADVWAFADRAKALGKQGPTSFKPTQDKVNGIIHALRARSQLGSNIDAPAWLANESSMPSPIEFAAVKNGLLHVPSGRIYPPTPTYFNTSASDVEYNKDAPPPDQWLTFLDQVFEGDQEAIDAAQEFMGYCLLPDTSQQKILLVVGPPRSGKGTIGRIMRELAGRDSVAGPTMHSLGGEFGLEPLIPRPVAIISDARIGSKTDKAAVTERLLSISGEDTLSVNRKNSSFWHGKLQTRFIVLTNELPALADGSGALANRFIILVMQNSFLGKEDPGLFDRLKTELPGILNWSIQGYQRLRERGYFKQPKSGAEALEEIINLASPVKAFIRDCCEIGAGLQIDVDFLWEEYTLWVEKTGGKFAGTKDWFGRNLRSAVPGIRKADAYPKGVRTPIYKGIGLKKGTGRLKEEDIPF